MAKKPQDRLKALIREVERDLQKTAKQLRKAATDVAAQVEKFIRELGKGLQGKSTPAAKKPAKRPAARKTARKKAAVKRAPAKKKTAAKKTTNVRIDKIGK